MPPRPLPRLRFSLRTLLILSIGVAIGYMLNLRTWRVLTGAASEARKMAMPTYVIEPPDVLRIDVFPQEPQLGAPASISGKHLVGMDGRVNLGEYGSVYVAGMTIDGATAAVAKHVASRIPSPQVLVDVLASNSKVYYVVVKSGTGKGDSVTRLPITGNETVIDGVASCGGLSNLQSAQMWIARPSSDGARPEQILTVDWQAIAAGADASSNYQIFPGDRLVIDRSSAAARSGATTRRNNPYSAADASDDQILQTIALERQAEREDRPPPR